MRFSVFDWRDAIFLLKIPSKMAIIRKAGLISYLFDLMKSCFLELACPL
jgi:hypothetical protein